MPKRYLTIFCGARTGADPRYARIAADAARAVIASGAGIVYGGGRVGLMGVLADAALEAGGRVIGVIPQALMTAEIAHGALTTLHVVGSMHERKALMADISDGFVALPGGYGTMDEFCEILTWAQLGIHRKPIGLLNAGGYYDELLALFATFSREGFVPPADVPLFQSAPDIPSLLAGFGKPW
ncbi:MAG: TIGR00730 family Rossman fold protein [Candidatus Baltobacteraceae bacterium]